MLTTRPGTSASGSSGLGRQLEIAAPSQHRPGARVAPGRGHGAARPNGSWPPGPHPRNQDPTAFPGPADRHRSSTRRAKSMRSSRRSTAAVASPSRRLRCSESVRAIARRRSRALRQLCWRVFASLPSLAALYRAGVSHERHLPRGHWAVHVPLENLVSAGAAREIEAGRCEADVPGSCPSRLASKP
jgi:hypothetical protein